MLFSDHIPPDILANPRVAKIVKVLDELLVSSDWDDGYFGKTVEMGDVAKSFDPIRLGSAILLRKFLYELGNISWIDGMPKIIYERMILNAYDIMACKGSKRGLDILARSLWLGDIRYDSSNVFGAHYIVPDDIVHCGYLPNGEDLLVQDTEETQFHYLFNGEFEYYYGKIELRLISRYFGIEQFRKFVASVLVQYIAWFHTDYTVAKIKFYNYGFMHGHHLFYSDMEHVSPERLEDDWLKTLRT